MSIRTDNFSPLPPKSLLLRRPQLLPRNQHPPGLRSHQNLSLIQKAAYSRYLLKGARSRGKKKKDAYEEVTYIYSVYI